MSATAYTTKADALTAKDSLNGKRVESKVSETQHPNNIAAMYAYNTCNGTLCKTYKSTSHNHHYKEVTTLGSLFTKSAYRKGKDTWPKRTTEKSNTCKCIDTDIAFSKHTYYQRYYT